MDYDDDEGRSPEEPKAPTDDIEELRQRLDKAEKRNYELREKVRRTEFVATYGEEIADLVPAGLKAEEAKELADKLAERLKPSQEPEPTSTTDTAEPPVEEPTGLAAVNGNPAPGSATAGELMTVAEIKELAQSDPIRAAQLVNQGKFKHSAPL